MVCYPNSTYLTYLLIYFIYHGYITLKCEWLQTTYVVWEQDNKQTSQIYVGSIRSSTSRAFSPTNGPKRLPFFMAFLHHNP